MHICHHRPGCFAKGLCRDGEQDPSQQRQGYSNIRVPRPGRNYHRSEHDYPERAVRNGCDGSLPTYTVSPLALQDATSPSGTIRNFSTPQTYTVTAENGSIKDLYRDGHGGRGEFGQGHPDLQLRRLGCRHHFRHQHYGLCATNPVPDQSRAHLHAFALRHPHPLSGSPQNFTNPQTYTVTAQNGITKAYTVAVTDLSVMDLLRLALSS